MAAGRGGPSPTTYLTDRKWRSGLCVNVFVAAGVVTACWAGVASSGLGHRRRPTPGEEAQDSECPVGQGMYTAENGFCFQSSTSAVRVHMSYFRVGLSIYCFRRCAYTMPTGHGGNVRAIIRPPVGGPDN